MKVCVITLILKIKLEFFRLLFIIVNSLKRVGMRNLSKLLILIGIVSMTGCAMGPDWELTGVEGRRAWFHPQPYGTVYIPTGTYHSGQSDQPGKLRPLVERSHPGGRRPIICRGSSGGRCRRRGRDPPRGHCPCL